MKLSYSFMIAVALSAPVIASPLPDMPTEKLIEICSNPDAPDAMKSDAASELTFRDKLKLEGQQVEIALTCLHSVFGVAFTYNGFSVFSPDLDAAAAAKRKEEAAKRAQAAVSREEAYLSALSQACYDELEVDRFRALTTSICAQVFVRDGLPVE